MIFSVLLNIEMVKLFKTLDAVFIAEKKIVEVTRMHSSRMCTARTLPYGGLCQIPPRQSPPGQRPPRQRPPGQRPLDREPPDRDPLDRDPLDRDPLTETPLLDRDPPDRDLPTENPLDRDPHPVDRDPPVDRQTPVKTLPSQTSFPGGKNARRN